VQFAGFSEAVVCFDTMAGGVDVNGTMINTVAGNSSVVGYAIDLGNGESVTGGPAFVLPFDEIGVFEIDAFAMQGDGCGAVVPSTIFVGPPDGSAVGHVTISPLQTALDVSVGMTGVEVSNVIDCTRDFAAGSEVFFRSTMGELAGLNGTGAGLSLTINPQGAGSFQFSASSAPTAGVAEIIAWSPGQTVTGQANIVLSGDDLAPTVWDQDPLGYVVQDVEEVRLTFSEPLLASSVEPEDFVVSGAFPMGIDKVFQEDDDRVVVVKFDSPIPGGTGIWEISAEGMRDYAGGLLDGAWVGTASMYTGAFGGQSVVSSVFECSQSAPSITPDGDDGAGSQADHVMVFFESSDSPAWWVYSVYSPQGGLILREFDFPQGTSDSWLWDGRDVERRVVPNGIYTLTVDSEDALGNRGGACARPVTVDNYREPH
jgi:hypothetical protein